MTRLKKNVDHFFMVMNLAIDREVLKPSVRIVYGLDVNHKNIPVIYSHNKITYWAENIIGGETHRIATGGIPVQFPSIADVKAAYDDYIEKHSSQNLLKNNFDLQQEDVEHLRKQIKSLVRDAWDQIEFYFRKDVPSLLRQKARGWGVEYGTRKSEKPEEGDE